MLHVAKGLLGNSDNKRLVARTLSSGHMERSR
jgi:hypothetical protein